MGLAAALYLALSPFMWFYGATVATYSFDAFASVLLILLAWRARPGGLHGVGAAVVLGLSGGFRQTSLILLAPLTAIAVLRSSKRVRDYLVSALAGAGTVAAWLIPMSLEQPGGLSALQEMNREMWESTVVKTSVLLGGARELVVNNAGQASGYSLAALHLLVPLGLAAGLYLVLRSSSRRQLGRKAGIAYLILAAAVVPSLALIFLIHFGKAGYVLSFLPGAVMLAVLPAATLPKLARTLVFAVVIVASSFNAQRFVWGEGVLTHCRETAPIWIGDCAFGAPYRMTAFNIERGDFDTVGYLPLRNALDPERHVLIYVWGNGSHRLRLWSLPEFTVHLLKDGKSLYYGRNLDLTLRSSPFVEVPPGGAAALVLQIPTAEIESLVARGQAEPVTLPTGPTVWLVRPANTIFGVELVERR